MSANFTPSLNSYTDLTPFRFWCQKILPLVYDDSLSYYELLCKVVDYLNKTMEDVNLSIEDVEKLHTAYDSLQKYVNDYFDNLDVQEEINNKLDALVEDGTIHDIFNSDVEAILNTASQAAHDAIEAIPSNVTAWLDTHVTPETDVLIDESLTIDGAAADAKATGDQIRALKSDLSNAGAPYSAPDLYDHSAYANPLTGFSVVSDAVIPSGSMITGIKLYSSAQVDVTIFLITNSNNICVKKTIASIQSGENNIKLDYLCEEEVRICFFGPVLYTNSNVDSKHAFSENGLTVTEPYVPNVGDTVTLSTRFSGKFAILAQWNVISNYFLQVHENTDSIVELKQEIGTTLRNPDTYDDSAYSNLLSDMTVVSDKVISAGTYIEKIRVYTESANTPGYVFLFYNNLCVWKKQFSNILSGWNDLTIDFRPENDVRIAVYGFGVRYTNSGVAENYAFSTPLHVATPYIPSVGDSVSITDTYSGNFALSVQWVVQTGLASQVEENASSLGSLNEDVESLKKGKIYDHTAIFSFIDDDTGKYVPLIWDDILNETGIRMGFACITGYMSGSATPPEIYEQMPLADLQRLYNAGNEVYSHSYSHPAFYSPETTPEMVEEQCRLSKQWLESNGFQRTANTIVYPGGLGANQTDKLNVVRQFYHFGVDTIGGGINPEPLANDLTIYRYNADTASLDELKAKVDEAINENALLVFMNHAYELNRDRETQVQKMKDIINYIKQNNGVIIPLTEALHRIYGW